MSTIREYKYVGLDDEYLTGLKHGSILEAAGVCSTPYRIGVRFNDKNICLQEMVLEPVKTKHPVVGPRSSLKWVGVDLDGTLAIPVWTPDNPTSEIGGPIWVNIQKVRDVVEAGFKVIIHTSRAWTDYEAIEAWLNFYQIPFKEIQCGKPLYAAYIDDRAINASDADWTPRNGN